MLKLYLRSNPLIGAILFPKFKTIINTGFIKYNWIFLQWYILRYYMRSGM